MAHSTRAAASVLTLGIMIVCAALVLPGAAAEDVDWVMHDTSPIERLVSAYAVLPDGRIFICNGHDMNTSEITAENWIYDPYSLEWERVADCYRATELSAAVAMPDGKVYIFGGAEFGNPLTNVMIYDVENDYWSDGPDLPTTLSLTEAIAIDDNRILIAGGTTTLSFSSMVDKCYLFDISESTFTPAADLPDERAVGALVMYDDALYYLGGLDSSSNAKNTIFAYSIMWDYWWSSGTLPENLVQHAAVAGSDGNIYVIGGRNSFSWFSAGKDTAFAYNLFTQLTTPLPTLNDGIANAAAFELAGGKIMYMHGNDGNTANMDVFTIQAWEASASLSSASVGQGGSVWLRVSITSNFMEMHGMAGVVYLERDNGTYGAYYIDTIGENDALVEVSIPESLAPGTYALVLHNVNIGYGADQSFPFETLSLTVTEAPSMQDQLDDLNAQNDALQEDLDAANAELKKAVDAKLDAVIGYVILILVIAVLVVAVISLVRKK